MSFFAVALVEIGFILLTVFGFIEFNRAADVVRMVVIIIFRMTVTECLDYQGMFEASSRKWVKPVEVGRWSNDHELSKNQILQAALRSI